MGKFTLAAGFAAGYVMGTRAGRQQYEQIVATARSFMSNPKIQQTTETLQTSAGDMASRVKEKVSDKVQSRRGGSAATDGTYSSSAYDVVEVPDTRVTTGTAATDNNGAV